VVLINPAIEPLMHTLAPQAEIVTIPNGIDLERFRPAARLERERLRAEFGWDGRPRVLFVGRVMRRKGAHIAVASAALAEAGEFELVIVGPGRVEGATRNVTFTGPVTAEKVAMFYRAADAFLLPSVREGFPVTVQEALASGLPVIVSEPTVASRLQAAGDRAVRYAPAEAAAVLASIREVLRRHDADRTAIAAFARTLFDWNRTADSHLDLYDRVRVRSARARG
jgi:glycosyltransferase involved in cell wall biosynthesis